MGSIERKLARLEAASGERAVARIKELWKSLTDQEVVLIVADAEGVKLTARQEQERAYAEAKLLSGGMEGLLALAVRPEQCADEEQTNRRLRAVVEEAVFADGRRARLSLLLRKLEEQGA